MKLFSATLIFLLFALIFSTLVFADKGGGSHGGGDEGADDGGDGGGGDEGGDDQDDHGLHLRRTIDIQLKGPDQVEIVSTTEDGENEENRNEWSISLQVKHDNNHLARLRFKFFAINDEDRTTIDFDLRIAELLEYVEANGALGYQAGEEVGTPYVGKDWDSIVVDTPRVVGNVTIYSITCTTEDGVLTLRMRIATGLVVDPLDGYTLLPNLAKIDIAIDDFPRSNSNSNLALITRTRTKTSVRQEGSHSVSFAKAGDNIPFLGEFSWVNTVDADNVTAEVVASPIQKNGDNEGVYYEVSFSFIHPGTAHYVWDPAVGATAGGDAATLISWCSVVLSLFKHYIL